MKTNLVILCAVVGLALAGQGFGQVGAPDGGVQSPAKVPLDVRIVRFDVADAILRDGLSELSLKGIEGLHLGFEEIIRARIQDDPRDQGPHFSLHLQNRTVREVLDELCRSDPYYTWSLDGTTINVYPQAASSDPSYLLRVPIDSIAVNGIPNPDQALVPLSRRFPEQQVGYAGAGGENAYAEPWTAIFEKVTVRQFINRVAEHMGPQTSWI